MEGKRNDSLLLAQLLASKFNSSQVTHWLVFCVARGRGTVSGGTLGSPLMGSKKSPSKREEASKGPEPHVLRQ